MVTPLPILTGIILRDLISDKGTFQIQFLLVYFIYMHECICICVRVSVCVREGERNVGVCLHQRFNIVFLIGSIILKNENLFFMKLTKICVILRNIVAKC